MYDLSWLNPTPHAIAVYASQPLSPVATQHSLPSGRYSLTWAGLPPAGSRQLCLAHSLDHLVGTGEQRGRHFEARGRHGRDDPRPPGVTQRARWRVIWPPGLSSRSSPMRRPSEAQFVVFSLKSFVQDLVGSRIKLFHTAIIAGANQDLGLAVDV